MNFLYCTNVVLQKMLISHTCLRIWNIYDTVTYALNSNVPKCVSLFFLGGWGGCIWSMLYHQPGLLVHLSSLFIFAAHFDHLIVLLKPLKDAISLWFWGMIVCEVHQKTVAGYLTWSIGGSKALKPGEDLVPNFAKRNKSVRSGFWPSPLHQSCIFHQEGFGLQVSESSWQ